MIWCLAPSVSWASPIAGAAARRKAVLIAAVLCNTYSAKTLPRSSFDQIRQGIAVARDSLQPGDLVFFNTMRATASHVGIYIGENRFIHAPRSGKTVEIADMTNVYWQARFDGARRLPL